MLVQDSLKNLVSGLGTERDKVEHGRFQFRLVNKHELDSLYTSDWLAGSIIDAPCDDMTREWRQWKGGPKQIPAIEALERKLRVRQKVNIGLKQARLYGGSGILLGTGDADPSQELNPASVQKGALKFIHVLSRFEMEAGAVDRDPMSPTFGEPSYYEVFSQEKGSVRVHPTRVVRLLGLAPIEQSWSISGWGSSVLQRVFDAVRNATATAGNLASLVYESKVDVVSIPDLNRNAINPVWRDQVITRFALAAQAKSNHGMLLLDALEKYEQKKISLADLPKVLQSFLEIAAGAANMPVTRLLGTSAKGLNATGDGDIRHYYDTLSSRQEVELSPALDRLDAVLIRSALGANPASVSYEWKPLWQQTDAELAALALQKAQASQIYGSMGVMPKDALVTAIQGQLLQDDTYPGLEGILEAHPGKAEPLTAPTVKPVDPGKVVENIASNLSGLKE